MMRIRGLAILTLCLLAIGCGDATDDSAGDGNNAENNSAGNNATDNNSTGNNAENNADTSTLQAVVENAGWGDNVTISFGEDTFTIATDGIPDHEVLDVYAVPDGSTIGVTGSDSSHEIPLNPKVADEPTDTGLGTIGVAISGGLFFNPYEGDGTTIALDSNFEVDGAPFIDACNGHPLPLDGSYHYHGIPYCITDMLDQEGQHSVLLGYLLDGFPVYGGQDVNGEAPTDLDRCNSHFGPTPEFPDGIQHYHLTETAPYSIDCYVGEAPEGGGGMGGPPGGGPPGGGPPGGG